MNPTARSFIAVLVSGYIMWSMFSSMYFRVPLWMFLFVLGITFLVIDVLLSVVLERLRKNTP